MSALTVFIIRHAEKPPVKDGDPDFGPGLDQGGQPDPKSLAIRGWQRAGAWAALFGSGLGGSDYPQPTVIYAARPDIDEATKPSQRPHETILPLARKLGLQPQDQWAKEEVRGMAGEVMRLTGVVLISWEHEMIVAEGGMLSAFLGDQQVFGVLSDWPGNRFDVVLRLDRALPGAPWSFRQLFPRLLSGDEDVPL